jgi:hypothetical protein
MSNGREEQRNKRFLKKKMQLNFEKNKNNDVKDKNILKFARQQKSSGRLSMDDLKSAKKEFKKLSPGEKKARFGESDDYQDMVAKKLKIGMGDLFGAIGQRMPLMKDPGYGLAPTQRRSNTKAVLDSSGKPVENLTQKRSRGGMNEDGVVDLTTEMVIDE